MVSLVASVQGPSSPGHVEGGTSGLLACRRPARCEEELRLLTGLLSRLPTQFCIILPSCPRLSLARCPGQPSRHTGPLLPTPPPICRLGQCHSDLPAQTLVQGSAALPDPQLCPQGLVKSKWQVGWMAWEELCHDLCISPLPRNQMVNLKLGVASGAPASGSFWEAGSSQAKGKAF